MIGVNYTLNGNLGFFLGEKMNKSIVIIDGNSLINRAYYAMQRPMITKEGIYTQGIYGFLNMLNKIQEDYKPNYISVAFDMKAPTFRHLEFDEYKAGRKKMPPELAMQMPILKDILKAMKIHTVELEGYEADDLIGTISLLAEENNINPYIVTGDKDALQLASNNTKVIITKRGVTDFKIYDYDEMVKEYSLTPTQFIDLKGLMGDSSDNIPGIPGIGEKTGIELLKEFHSIENLIANTDSIKKTGIKKKVEEGYQLALMSKKLATINRHVPINIDLEALKVETPDYDSLIKLYTKLEFKSLLKKLNVFNEANSKEITSLIIKEVKKFIVKSPQDLIFLDQLETDKVFLKIFSDYNHISEPEFHSMFIMDDNTAILIDGMSVELNSIINKLKTKHFKFYGHNIKDDAFLLIKYGYEDFDVLYDTTVGEYVISSTKSEYDLKTLCLERLNIVIESEKDFTKNHSQLKILSDDLLDYMEYGISIASATEAIKNNQLIEIEDQNLSKVLYEIEIPLIKVMASMEVSGITTDKTFLVDFGKKLKGELDELEAEIYQLSGVEFNINSPKQLGDVLFEELKLPNGKKTKTGYSTSADILEKIKEQHPVVAKVLEYRALSKLNSTYVEGLIPLISSDNKIHAHFNQTVTATGRISCTEPNLQNIPIRSENGRLIRKAFTADEGYVLIGADYSQIELRVLAHLSQDEELINSFNKGEDIHKRTASGVLGIPLDEITPLDRSRAKAVNFGVIYGMSGFGLSEELHITRKEAEKYISDYFNNHKKVREFMDEQISKCKELGYVETIMGRKRYIKEIKASQFMVRQLGERLAMNTPIQGSAADIIKLAMLKVYDNLKTDFPDAKLVLQVHDELIIHGKVEDKVKIQELLIKSMEEAVNLSVKLTVDSNEANNWYELK